ncbi:hypothetical protein FRC08_008540 [Ceratobasidium sp. 394]|nr:hypothetical protein FRC08_008540 [Ceratobasidium sp. 394]
MARTKQTAGKHVRKSTAAVAPRQPMVVYQMQEDGTIMSFNPLSDSQEASPLDVQAQTIPCCKDTDKTIVHDSK